MTTMAERFRKWFDYETESHRKVLVSLESVPAERRSDPEFQKAIDLLAHIAAARRLWLFRFGVTPDGPKTFDELFAKNVDRSTLEKRIDATNELWSQYLETTTDEKLDRTFEYRALEGRVFRNRVEEILVQLFGHSWYHRGQIASIVRSLGGEPAVTDYVFWAREPLD